MKKHATKQVLKGRTVYVTNTLPAGIRPADFYNAGLYGWNWDAWVCGDIAVLYGYRNFPAGIVHIDAHKAIKLINGGQNER